MASKFFLLLRRGICNPILGCANHRGRTLHVSASVRVEVKDPKAKAYLVGATSLDSWVWAQAPGASWTKVNVNLDVPADADLILIGLVVVGAGAGFLDDIEVSSAP